VLLKKAILNSEFGVEFTVKAASEKAFQNSSPTLGVPESGCIHSMQIASSSERMMCDVMLHSHHLAS